MLLQTTKDCCILTIFSDLHFFMSTSDKEKIDNLDFFTCIRYSEQKRLLASKYWETLTSGSNVSQNFSNHRLKL